MTLKTLMADWSIRSWVPLLTRARRAGFDYRKVCDHVWVFRNPHWRIVIDGINDCEGSVRVEVSLHRRVLDPFSDEHALTIYPANVSEVDTVLTQLGVLEAVPV